MSLPSPTLSVPTLTADQMQFQGLVLGAGTAFQFTKIEGLDKPEVRSGNTDRPRTRGAFPGLNLLKSRVINVTFDVGPFSASNSGLVNLIPDPSFEYDAVGSAPPSAMWTQATTGSITANTFLVSNAWAQSGSNSLHIQGTHSADSTVETIGAQTPSTLISATAGLAYTIQAATNIVRGGPGVGIQLSLGWYTSGGVLISTSTSGVLNAGSTGPVTSTYTATAPASTAYVQVTVSALTVANGTIVEYYLDAVALAQTSSSFAYFDGDMSTLGWQWKTTAGASRTIPINGWGRYGAYGSSLAGAAAALRTATMTEGVTEFPLWIQLPGFPLVCCMARVLRKSIPYDITADLGGLVRGCVIQFEATDPYLYAAPTSAPTVNLPSTGLGFTFPVSFPLSFGGAAQNNQVTVVNNGDVPCWPLLTINGPCVNPSVSNQSISGNPTITTKITLNAGDQLVIDTDLQSIVYYPAGSSIGSYYPQVLGSGSTYFSLSPGSNILVFNSQDTSPAAGLLTVANASTYDGLL